MQEYHVGAVVVFTIIISEERYCVSMDSYFDFFNSFLQLEATSLKNRVCIYFVMKTSIWKSLAST